MSLRVMVVDDSSVMRAIVVKCLQLSGLDLDAVLEAANGQDALELLETRPVDIVLADINMPVMTGDEMIERLAADPRTAGIKVIVVSSDHTGARMEQLRERGIPIVHKPFNPQRIKELIVELTGATDGIRPQETAF
jgi:two-component system chemotaxis response regulator CheY